MMISFCRRPVSKSAKLRLYIVTAVPSAAHGAASKKALPKQFYCHESLTVGVVR